MANDEKTLPPVGKAEDLVRRYLAAESRFDAFLILVGGMKYTLVFFVAWSGLMIWIGARVFG